MPNTEIETVQAKPAKARVTIPKAVAKAAVSELAKAKALDMTGIITDKDKLQAFANRAIASYSSSGPMIHAAFVSALWHTATHGNPAILQRIYNALRPNDQTAAKMYLRRYSAVIGLEGENPDGQPSEIVQGAVSAGHMLELKQGSFIVVQGHTTKVAKEWAKLCAGRLIKANDREGSDDRLLLSRNSFSEIRTLDDTDVLKRILAAASNTESTANRKVHLSDATSKLLVKIKGLVEPRIDQIVSMGESSIN